MTDIQYPKTKATDDFSNTAGIRISDPYQWLQAENDEVAEWQGAQNGLTDTYMREWPHMEALNRSVHHYYVDRITTLPRYVAGRWHRAAQFDGSSAPGVVISDTAYGEGRVLRVPMPDAS